MHWLKRLFKQPPNKTASLAKERLQVIVAHERQSRNNPDFFITMQQEIMDVIAKYFPVDREQIKVEVGQSAERSVLELNLSIPEHSSETQTPETAGA